MQPGLSNTEIRQCVAKQARDAEPNAATLTLLVFGGALLTASVVTGIRSLRRVMTIPDAAEELGTRPAEVRQLIDRGVLEIHDRDQRAIYVNPEQVRRLTSVEPTEDQPVHA